MRKYAIFLGLLLTAFTAHAAITVGTAPASLVTTSTTLAASTPKAVFEFALTADDSETLSSVSILVNSTTATASDFASVKIYKDDGDNTFDSGDAEAGSNSTVNVGSSTLVNATSNNALTGGKFFVVLTTSAIWTGTDSATVTLNADGITTSDNSPSTSAVTTATLNADMTGPVLQSAVAANKASGTDAIEAGDKVILTFGEATNGAVINKTNINSVLDLTGGHSWTDGADEIGSAVWSDGNTVLTITLSAGTSVPTIAIDDTVTVSGSVIKDASNNNATGAKTITGTFGTSDSDNDEDDFGKTCSNTLINGKLYKEAGKDTVYLAAACRLKPFRGAAVFHARGHKFQDIKILSSLSGIEISSEPALPAGGTLVKGTDKTVWFVTKDGKKKGFVSETSFKRMGLSFGAVKEISDSDLLTMSTDTAIDEDDGLPSGMIAKCGNSATVFEVRGNSKFPFTNPQPFLERGHSWDVIATIDCGRFTLSAGSNISE